MYTWTAKSMALTKNYDFCKKGLEEAKVKNYNL